MRVLRALAMVFLISVLWTGGAVGDQEAGLCPKVLSFLREKLKAKAECKGVRFDEKVNMYIVRLMVDLGKVKMPVAAYVSKDKKILFLGKVFDFGTGELLTVKHLEGLKPKMPELRVDLSQLPSKGPFLGHGGEQLVLVASPHCPHCRKVLPELISAVKRHEKKYTLNYVHAGRLSPEEENRLVSCVRERAPQLFWEFLAQLYSEGLQKARQWLEEKAFPYDKCGKATTNQPAVPGIRAVPSLVLADGSVLTGENEIEDFIKKMDGEGKQ